MFKLGQDSKLLGAGHVALNVLRAFNIIGLAAVMMASMAMPVLSGIHGHFFFFDTATHLFVFFLATFLLVSELPVPWKKLKAYYDRNWPVVGSDHSLAWLGWGMVFIGFEILGDAWKPAYTADTLGLEWWRAILAAAILSVTFGFFNITASVIFRTTVDGLRGEPVKVTARQIRTYGNLALQKAVKKSDDIEHSLAASSHYSPPQHRDNWSAHSWAGGAAHSKEEEVVEPSSAVRRLTRVLNPRNINFNQFRKSRIQISKPIPHHQDAAVDSDHDDDRLPSSHGHVDTHHTYGNLGDGFGGDNGSNRIPSRDRSSPVVPGVERPPTALHPAYLGTNRSSLYSAAHMDRF
ncbi:hypothetical protein B0J18DRAFT_466920 [Chaetomium sp. MPI-SDFR-AT-0129]|nr:hypothetical protein B0J18DRAFT_466920 [Chaetomium sp. MPI-SDFR-AT-0129]